MQPTPPTTPPGLQRPQTAVGFAPGPDGGPLTHFGLAQRLLLASERAGRIDQAASELRRQYLALQLRRPYAAAAAPELVHAATQTDKVPADALFSAAWVVQGRQESCITLDSELDAPRRVLLHSPVAELAGLDTSPKGSCLRRPPRRHTTPERGAIGGVRITSFCDGEMLKSPAPSAAASSRRDSCSGRRNSRFSTPRGSLGSPPFESAGQCASPLPDRAASPGPGSAERSAQPSAIYVLSLNDTQEVSMQIGDDQDSLPATPANPRLVSEALPADDIGPYLKPEVDRIVSLTGVEAAVASVLEMISNAEVSDRRAVTAAAERWIARSRASVGHLSSQKYGDGIQTATAMGTTAGPTASTAAVRASVYPADYTPPISAWDTIVSMSAWKTPLGLIWPEDTIMQLAADARAAAARHDKSDLVPDKVPVQCKDTESFCAPIYAYTAQLLHPVVWTVWSADAARWVLLPQVEWVLLEKTHVRSKLSAESPQLALSSELQHVLSAFGCGPGERTRGATRVAYYDMGLSVFMFAGVVFVRYENMCRGDMDSSPLHDAACWLPDVSAFQALREDSPPRCDTDTQMQSRRLRRIKSDPIPGSLTRSETGPAVTGRASSWVTAQRVRRRREQQQQQQQEEEGGLPPRAFTTGPPGAEPEDDFQEEPPDLIPPGVFEYVLARACDEPSRGSGWEASPLQSDPVRHLISQCYASTNQKKYSKDLYEKMQGVLGQSVELGGSSMLRIPAEIVRSMVAVKTEGAVDLTPHNIVCAMSLQLLRWQDRHILVALTGGRPYVLVDVDVPLTFAGTFPGRSCTTGNTQRRTILPAGSPGAPVRVHEIFRVANELTDHPYMHINRTIRASQFGEGHATITVDAEADVTRPRQPPVAGLYEWDSADTAAPAFQHTEHNHTIQFVNGGWERAGPKQTGLLLPREGKWQVTLIRDTTRCSSAPVSPNRSPRASPSSGAGKVPHVGTVNISSHPCSGSLLPLSPMRGVVSDVRAARRPVLSTVSLHLDHVRVRLGKSLLEEVRPIIWYLRRALEAVPPPDEEGRDAKGRTVVKCYRGLSDVVLSPHVYYTGGIVCWGAFSSSSTDQGVAASFASGSAASVFTLWGFSGRCVAPWSRFGRECEYIYPMNTLFHLTALLTEEQQQILDKEQLQLYEMHEIDEWESHQVRVRRCLARATTEAAASVVFRAVTIFSSEESLAEGVLDLSLQNAQEGRLSARWQVRTNVAHDPLGKCPPGLSASGEWQTATDQDLCKQICEQAQQPDAKEQELPKSEVAELLGIEAATMGEAVCIRRPRRPGAHVELTCGAKADEYQKGVLVERDPVGWGNAPDDDGGQGCPGLVEGISHMRGEGLDLSIRWLRTGLKRMVVQRKVRHAPMGGWRVEIELRHSHGRAGFAVGPDGAKVLGAVLELGVPIRRVGLYNNEVREEGANDILNGLRHNSNCVEVELGPDDAPQLVRAAIALRCHYHALGPREALSCDHLMMASLGPQWVDVATNALWDLSELRLPLDSLAQCPREASRLADQISDRRADEVNMTGETRFECPPVGMLLLRTVSNARVRNSFRRLEGSVLPEGDLDFGATCNSIYVPGGVSGLTGPGGELSSPGPQQDTPAQSSSKPSSTGRALRPRNSVRSGSLKSTRSFLMVARHSLEELVHMGSDPDERDCEGRTPLHHAALRGMPDIAEKLLQLGARPDILDDRGHVPVLDAARDSGFRAPDGTPLPVLRSLATPAALKASGQSGRDALNLAAFEGPGDPAAVCLLCDMGSDVTAATSDGHWVPLHVAMKLGFRKSEAAVERLVTPQTLVARDDKGRTPLHYAAMTGGELTEMLLRLGKARDSDCGIAAAEDCFGNTALHFAAYNGHARAAQALLHAGAPTDVRNKFGHTPLSQAEARVNEVSQEEKRAFAHTAAVIRDHLDGVRGGHLSDSDFPQLSPDSPEPAT